MIKVVPTSAFFSTYTSQHLETSDDYKFSVQVCFDLATSAMGKTPDVDVPFEPLLKLHNKA